MGPLEFIGEICTFDSAFIRGWRWLFSPRYREEVRITRCRHRPWFFVAGVLETMILMLAEGVAMVFVARWLFGLSD